MQFVQRLRDELKFDSVDALIEQMALDVDEARSILSLTGYQGSSGTAKRSL